MKVLLPDFTSPIFWLGMILIAIYAYIGGKWLDSRNKAHADKLQEDERKKRIKEFKSEKI
jgi:uncharacterized membrane protein